MFFDGENRGKKIAVVIIVAILIITCIIAWRSVYSGDELILATTTSTYDSGLLDEIVPMFEEEHDVRVRVMATGTGQALALGERGDADVLLVHSPEKEEEFIDSGHGNARYEVMYNEYVIVGPSDDPAGIRGMDDAEAAFELLYEEGATFCSRGDDSGTHMKELDIWEGADIEKDEIEDSDRYRSLGQGMGDTLRTANEFGDAYTLADESTYISLKEDLVELDILVRDEETLFNQYSVIPVSGARNSETAEDFAQWIVSDEIQGVIDEYTVKGERIFTANAKKTI